MAIPKKLLSRTTYPSDISRDQFQLIAPLLESARRKTKPRKVDLYEVFCGVLYVLKSGCQWDMLPEDFSKWRTVYNYWQIWNEQPIDDTGILQPSVLERVLKKSGWHGPTQPWSLSDDH